MQITGFNYPLSAGNDYYFSTSGAQVTSSYNSSEVNKSNLQLSPLMQIAYQHKLSEFSYTSDETIIGYRSEDNSMALRAHSYTDYHSSQETISIEATFSAEALGLTAEDFAAIGNKPIEFSFSFQKSDLNIKYEATSQVITPTRSADDLLKDLGKAIMKVMKDKGKDNYVITFDDEAIRTLMSDPEIAKVFQQILGLINLINMMKRQAADSKTKEIEISGKGKPYLDVDEKTTIDAKDTTVDIKFTILPPAAAAAEAEAAAELEPAPTESGVDVTA